MASRNHLDPQKVITSGDMSGNINSKATILNQLSGGSYSFSWTGTSPVGTISLQLSDDYALNPDGTVLNAGTWNTAPLDQSDSQVTAIPLSGNTGNGMIDIMLTGAWACRVIYTFTSGTGSLTAIFTGKVA